MARIAPPTRLVASSASIAGIGGTTHTGSGVLYSPLPQVEGYSEREVYSTSAGLSLTSIPYINSSGQVSAGSNFINSTLASLFAPVPFLAGLQHTKKGMLENDVIEGAYTLSIINAPLYGAFQYMNNGSFKYSAKPDYAGTDTITYQIEDVINTDTANINVTINTVTISALPTSITLLPGQVFTLYPYINDDAGIRTGSALLGLSGQGYVTYYDDIGNERVQANTFGPTSPEEVNLDFRVYFP